MACGRTCLNNYQGVSAPTSQRLSPRASPTTTQNACCPSWKLVEINQRQQEDAYPKGPSVMFFKMFLDEDIRSQLSAYDALAIVEWDVLVASDRSFEELYHAAFRVNEEFWVKGSNLEGTNLHSSAEVSEMWRVLGHINGNAIYNNNDPAFVEYVEYTRARWEYKYPYDVALWLTISDFPYSWPLYQRYSSKFVITNLVSSCAEVVSGERRKRRQATCTHVKLASVTLCAHTALMSLCLGPAVVFCLRFPSFFLKFLCVKNFTINLCIEQQLNRRIRPRSCGGVLS